jgi:predicted O-methyltransferase YrrM
MLATPEGVAFSERQNLSYYHRSMNKVLKDIVETRRTLLPCGEFAQVDSDIDPQCGALLQEAIHLTRPKIAVEVGLAFGISTLYILSALEEVNGLKLIGMDPAQSDNHWQRGGLHNVRRAGYERLYEFHELESQQVLPSLVRQGQKIQFAFIDGWHTFDHTLIDFFYIDQMLEPGGIVVFDDVGYPAIKRVCDFVITNRGYEIHRSLRHSIENSFRRRSKLFLQGALDRLVRTDKTPSAQTRSKEFSIGDAYFLALRKRAHDTRRWDHFVHF